MTGTVSLCEQQLVVIYFHCVTVWGNSGKKTTKLSLGSFVHFFPFILHVTTVEMLNTLSCNKIFLVFDTFPLAYHVF